MRNKKIHFVFAALLIALACTAPRGAAIQDTQEPRHARGDIPEAAVTTLRAFISYILGSDTDLFHDKAAQEKFLTEDLRKAVAHRWKLYQEIIKKRQVHSPPGNGTFVGAWEYPAGYTVEGARRSENRLVIDVIYKWEDSQTNYYGDTRRVSYTFLSEGGVWKLDDAFTHKGKFVRA